MKSLRTRFTFLLGISALGLATISCDTTGQDEFAEDMNALRSVSANILLHEDFNGNDAFKQVHQQFGTKHAFNIIEDPKDKGNKVGRFELREKDPIQSNGKRSEVLFPAQSGKDRWYSYSIYLPANGFKKDSNNDIITQWHQSGGGSPATTLRVNEEMFSFRFGNKKEDREDFELVPAEKDVWHDFVFHIIHSPNSDGLIEIWHNGEKVLEEKGGNMYNMAMPRWKIGIYKSAWGSRSTDTDVRVLLFDNVKLGNEKASLEEMTHARNNSAESSSASNASSNSTSTSTSSTSGGSTSTTSDPAPPAPSTPAPSTPAPSTPAPSTPAPSTPAPSTPAPSTPATSTPAPPAPPVANLPAPRTPRPANATTPARPNASQVPGYTPQGTQLTPAATGSTSTESNNNSQEEND
jgi:hypothetical protein